MAAAKNQTQPTAASIDAFLDGLADQQRAADSRRLLPLFERITGEKPVLWGPAIIGFGQYHYKYASGREGDSPIAAFSPRKNDTTLYIGTWEGLAAMLARLGKHKMSGGCLHVKRLADVDLAVLEEIVAESARITREKNPPC